MQGIGQIYLHDCTVCLLLLKEVWRTPTINGSNLKTLFNIVEERFFFFFFFTLMSVLYNDV